MHHRARARVSRVRTDMHTQTNSEACPTGHGVLSAPVVAVRVVLRVIVAAIVVAASIVRRRVPQHRGSHGVEWSVPHVEQLCLLKRRRVSVLAQTALGGHTAPRCRPHHAASFPDCASTLRAARDRPQFSHADTWCAEAPPDMPELASMAEPTRTMAAAAATAAIGTAHRAHVHRAHGVRLRTAGRPLALNAPPKISP
jgi:hypothetical protein